MLLQCCGKIENRTESRAERERHTDPEVREWIWLFFTMRWVETCHNPCHHNCLDFECCSVISSASFKPSEFGESRLLHSFNWNVLNIEFLIRRWSINLRTISDNKKMGSSEVRAVLFLQLSENFTSSPIGLNRSKQILAVEYVITFGSNTLMDFFFQLRLCDHNKVAMNRISLHWMRFIVELCKR